MERKQEFDKEIKGRESYARKGQRSGKGERKKEQWEIEEEKG